MVRALFVLTLPTLLLGSLVKSTPEAGTQDAEVTFYSNGNPFTTVASHADHAMFVGTLFDGEQPIGFLQPKRFLTIHLPTGPHVFSGSLSRKKPDRRAQLPLVLTPGENYFVRAQMESRGIIVTLEKDRLDSVSCQVAHEEAETERPTDPRRVERAMRDRIAPVVSLPPCK
jgi:hypothetical protein